MAGMKMTAMDRKYRSESDCRTLQDADEIHHDRGRLRGARSHAKKKLSSYRRIAKGKR